MAVCKYCGKRFKVKEVAEEFGFQTGYSYNDLYSRHDTCLECAVNETGESMAAWEDMEKYYTCDD